VTIVSGDELRSPKGRGFLFRFGGGVGGKAIPVLPGRFGNRIKPDKIAAVMIYVTKKPPQLLREEGLSFDGVHAIDGIPYYGDPLRGGVRVYQDDRLVLQIKRPLLRQTAPVAGSEAEPRWQLWNLLEARGVDTSRIAEGWVIRDERRRERLTREQLRSLTFTAGERGQSRILLGDEHIPASALALHARPLLPAELPQLLPSEQD
jgi:hypothetical protein